MSAYVVVSLTIKDQVKLEQYSAKAASTVAQFNGTFIAKSPSLSLHGDSGFAVKVLIEFKDKLTAQNWYASQEYQALIANRNDAMDSVFELVG